MTHQSSSPPLIKGTDWIVSRSPNEVNYSILNGKKLETEKQQRKEVRRNYIKYGLKKIKRYVKQEENAGKRNLMELANKNEIQTIKKDVYAYGQEGGETGEPQW